MKQVTVFGANGDSGLAIVRSLVEQGWDVVAAVRRPETMAEEDAQQEKVRVVAIDFADESTIRSAVDGSVAVVSAIGSGKLKAARNPTTVYRDATRAIRSAMRQHKIKRLVVLSSGGVDEDEHGPWLYNNVFRRYIMNTYVDMARMETVLEESSDDLDWTSVRLTYLCEGESKPYIVEDRMIGMPCSFTIHFCDVGKFVAQELEENKWVHKMPVVAYP